MEDEERNSSESRPLCTVLHNTPDMEVTYLTNEQLQSISLPQFRPRFLQPAWKYFFIPQWTGEQFCVEHVIVFYAPSAGALDSSEKSCPHRKGTLMQTTRVNFVEVGRISAILAQRRISKRSDATAVTW